MLRANVCIQNQSMHLNPRQKYHGDFVLADQIAGFSPQGIFFHFGFCPRTPFSYVCDQMESNPQGLFRATRIPEAVATLSSQSLRNKQIGLPVYNILLFLIIQF